MNTFEYLTLPVTPFGQNARVLYCPKSRKAVAVDPGGEGSRIYEEIANRNLKCEQIWLTHSHLDHCGGVSELKALTGAKLYAHSFEKGMRGQVELQCEMFGIPPGAMKNCPEPEVYLEDGDVISLAENDFIVLFTPGHSPGHVVFFHKPSATLIGGDVLFQGSVGRTDLPGGDHRTLLKSIRRLIEELPPETKLLPGHGEETTLGTEAATNPFLIGAI